MFFSILETLLEFFLFEYSKLPDLGRRRGSEDKFDMKDGQAGSDKPEVLEVEEVSVERWETK